MIACGAQLRKLSRGYQGSQEEIAQRISNFLYHSLRDLDSGSHELIMARVYCTTVAHLPRSLRTSIPEACSETMRCLILLGTSGQEPEWNQRSHTKSHQVIPLQDEQVLRAAPMLAGLFSSFGLDLASITHKDFSEIRNPAQPSQ